MGYASINSGHGMGPLQTPSLNLEVKLEGEWKKFDTLMKYFKGGTFNRGIKRDIAKAERDFLTANRKNLIAGLESGGSKIKANWPAHSGAYKSGKGIGIKHGYYLNAIKNTRIIAKGYVVSLMLGKGDASFVPVSGKGKNPMSVGQYALIFERGRKGGSSKQPARPLWGAAFEYTGGKKQVLANMTGAIGKRLGKMGIHIRTKNRRYVK